MFSRGQTERFGGAFSASLVSHAAFIWLLYVLLTSPGPTSRLAEESRRAFSGLVWLDRAGPGGGGGGGGNRSAAPPRRLETVGADAFSIPVLETPSLTTPSELPKENDPPPMALLLPVRPMDAGQLAAAGIVEHANLAPTSSQGPGTGDGGGTGRGPGSGPDDGPGLGPGFRGGNGGEFEVGGNVLSPVLLREVKPEYTPEAIRARIQGDVVVAAVVAPDGTVSRVRVVRSLDAAYGLDDQALKAVRQWRFKPGTRAGQPVAVLVQISVGFNMR